MKFPFGLRVPFISAVVFVVRKWDVPSISAVFMPVVVEAETEEEAQQQQQWNSCVMHLENVIV